MQADLSVDSLISAAGQLVTGGFSQAECATHLIDPCPTLAELTSGSA
jgi:hypothetical protein